MLPLEVLADARGVSGVIKSEIPHAPQEKYLHIHQGMAQRASVRSEVRRRLANWKFGGVVVLTLAGGDSQLAVHGGHHAVLAVSRGPP